MLYMLFHRRKLRSIYRRCALIFLATLIFMTTFKIYQILLDEKTFNSSEYAMQNHSLCVTIPYRDRFDELQTMIPMLHHFVTSQQIVPRYILINQTNEFRFNRASLINIGVLEAERMGCDYTAIHDVDIVPLNPNLSYHYPINHIMHLTPGKYHPIVRYDYKTFIGGVLLITIAAFKKVNGMSNEYWGWGLEDDDFYARLKNAGLAENIQRPSSLTTNRTNTFLHLHGKSRQRDYRRKEYRLARKKKRNFSSGLSDLIYTLRAKFIRRIREVNITVLDVSLICNPKLTPNCYV